MAIFYFIAVKCYGLFIAVGSIFNDKARQWMRGRKGLFSLMRTTLKPDEQRIWIHCSSLGEFEQGRPVMERIRQEFPQFKLVVTFFSPSGYKAKKLDTIADYVFYLPLDGPHNAKRFLDLVKPHAAFFVKYEFWHFYIYECKRRKIPSYAFSCNFRPSQVYFKWYGFFFDKILRRISHIFVQNQRSLELLYKRSIPHVTVSGDTRFDRVVATRDNNRSLEIVEIFHQNKKVFIAGSTWPADDDIICKLINDCTDDYKFIIAPHEISETKLSELLQKIKKTAVRYSQFTIDKKECDVMIIDNIGLLSTLYRYGTITYVGGGFGTGIHNILEPAVYGLPVIVAPQYSKFNEALALLKIRGMFVVKNHQTLKTVFDDLKYNFEKLQAIKTANLKYIDQQKGATDIIINYLKLNWEE